jgi:hypothetical protein
VGEREGGVGVAERREVPQFCAWLSFFSLWEAKALFFVLVSFPWGDEKILGRKSGRGSGEDCVEGC